MHETTLDLASPGMALRRDKYYCIKTINLFSVSSCRLAKVYALPQQWGQATQGRIQHYAQGIEENFLRDIF
jgi:hypothetical protein